MANIGFIGDATFKQTVLNWTIQMVNSDKNSTANIIAPEVKVPTMAGYYQTFDTKLGFSVQDTRKEPGQKAVQIARPSSQTAYIIEPNALDSPIPKQLLESENEQEALVNYQSFLMQELGAAITTKEKKVWDIISGSVTTDTAYGANWTSATGSTPNVNPCGELETAAYKMWTNTGVFPNVCVVGPAAWRALKFSTAARGSFPAYATNDNNFQTYLQGFGQGGLKIAVATMGYSNNAGQSTRTVTGIVETNALYLGYCAPTPYLGDPSGAKQLVFGPGLSNLRTYWSEDQRDLVLALDWNFLPIVSNSSAITRIIVT